MVSWNYLKLNTPKGIPHSLALLPCVCSECMHSFTVGQSRLTWSPLCNCISCLPSGYEEIPGKGSPKHGRFILVHSLRAESIVGETSRRQELDAAGRDASPVLQQREMRGDACLLSPYSIRDPNHGMMLHTWWVFPPQLTKKPSGTYPEIWYNSDSESCQVDNQN